VLRVVKLFCSQLKARAKAVKGRGEGGWQLSWHRKVISRVHACACVCNHVHVYVCTHVGDFFDMG
jgi:hypothetical protein